MTSNEKRLKRKKTSAKKNTKNPQYNESLIFTIPNNSLCDTVLEIEVTTFLNVFFVLNFLGKYSLYE